MIVCLWVPLKGSSPAALQPSATASPPAHRSFTHTIIHPYIQSSIHPYNHPSTHPCYIYHLNMPTEGHFIPFTLFLLFDTKVRHVYMDLRKSNTGSQVEPLSHRVDKTLSIPGRWLQSHSPKPGVHFLIPNSWPKHKNTWFNFIRGLFQKWSEKVFPFSSKLHIWAMYLCYASVCCSFLSEGLHDVLYII